MKNKSMQEDMDDIQLAKTTSNIKIECSETSSEHSSGKFFVDSPQNIAQVLKTSDCIEPSRPKPPEFAPSQQLTNKQVRRARVKKLQPAGDPSVIYKQGICCK